MRMDAELVCIVLVNWNGWRDTAECLHSCLNLDYPSFHAIVVDNGSTDESVERLRTEFADDDVTLIEAGANLGFAGGCNVGIEAAFDLGARYVWLLNNDTVIEPRTLTPLVETLANQPYAGIAGSKIYFFDRPDTLWFAGGIISKWGWTRHRGEGEVDHGQFDETCDVDYATGASLLIRRDVAETVGLMSEDFFLYWEEVDWCERARAAGWRIVYVPTSRVWHKVGASTPDERAHTKWRYEGRNRMLFYKRNRPALLAKTGLASAANALYLLLRGRPRSALSLSRGVLDGLFGLSTGAYRE